MAKKRPNEDSSASSSSQAKKEKLAEFNGTVFKSMLKDPTKAMKGLETFLSIAKKLPCAELYDVVEGYIKISMECAELFKLLEGEKLIESEMILIFQSFEMVLLRTASDLSHFSMVGTTIVRKIISSYMRLILESIHSQNYRLVCQCLSLLSAMVAQGQDSAREVFTLIHFNKGLFALARKKKTMGKSDVRVAFIRFALSFLVSGDSTTVGQLLEIKEFLPEILNSELNKERMSIVNLILSTLSTGVVQNKGLSKTQKIRFFSPSVLANIASLYKWNGILDARTDESKTVENPEQVGKLVIRELVHKFLLDLCCSRKHGINFYDPSLGTAGKVGNVVLLQFLVGLKQATEDELVAELVVSILKISPDILPRYFKETQYSFTPRLTSAWQDNVKLLKKIYEAQPEISKVFPTQEAVPVSRLLSMIMVTSLPPVCNKAFFTQGLNFANIAVQHTTLSMMSFILNRANKNMEYCLDKSVWQSSDIYTPDMMEDLVLQYRETLSKTFPDMTNILSKWQSLANKNKAESGEKKSEKEASSDVKDAKTNVLVADTAEVILLKALILQVICLYQKVAPHLVTQCKFDFSKLLKGIVSEKGMREEVPPVLQYQILQLALDLPASKFSWFRIQDIVDTEATSGEKSVLYLLLKMFASSNNSHLKTSTRMLVLKVLKDSGVFEYTWMELELWLNHLTKLEPAQQEAVIQFLERVLVRLVCNPHTYTDKVASLVQEAAYVQANLSGQEGDAVSIPISHIDDVLDMVDVIMDGNEGEMEDFGPCLSDDLIIQTFPFSPVVPAVLEARNKLPLAFKVENGVVYEFMAAVLSDVLHCQRDPLPLCLALQQYDKELVSSEDSGDPHPSVIHFHHYYSKWIPQPSQEELFKSSECKSPGLPDPSSFSTLMKAAYNQGPSIFLEDGFKSNAEASLATMEMTEFPVATRQILLYIKSIVDNFGTLSKDICTPVLKTLMGILFDMVNKLKGIQKAANSEPMEVDLQEGSDLFLESNPSATEANRDEILLAVLSSIFKHPCFEQWFLALELAALPPHSLNPVRLKHLCGQLTDDLLVLLKTCTSQLRDLGQLELLSSYMAAVERAVLRELEVKSSQAPKSQSRPIQALLSLHSYMDSSHLKEVVSTLLLLPQQSLIAPSNDETPDELSVYGHAALQILTESNSNHSTDHRFCLTQVHLHGLATLFLSCSSPALEAFLLQRLSTEPGDAKLIHEDILLHCLQRPLPATQAICSLLLQNCTTHRLRFELWCLEPANLAQLSCQTEAFLPLLTTYLQAASREDPARPKDVQTQVLKALKQALLDRLCHSVLGDDKTEDSVILHAETLACLVKLAADVKDITDLINKLPTALHTVGHFERWQLVDVVSEKLDDCPAEQEPWRKSVIAAAVKWLISSYNYSKIQATAPSAQEESVLHRLQRILTAPEDITPSDWNSFVKNGLKYRYKDRHFLSTLSDLLELMYSGTAAANNLLPLATMHMMISSHSLFLPTMLDSKNDPSGDLQNLQTKEAVVWLLLCLVKKCPLVCNVNHFVVLLGAYGATLSTSDQKLLLLLREYERNNISLLKFQSLLWGPAAVEHHKARKSLGASLWQQASSEDLLALLTSERMLHTIAHFPQHRRILPQEGKELYKDTEVNDAGNLYDPCFLLPLFSAMLRPESVIDCLKFVSSHALGFTFVALSSNDSKVRAAAYHVLSSFYLHLEAARLKEKRQLLYLMDTVKNSIRQQNLRLPFVLTTYIAKVTQQMLKPEDHMYAMVNKFLLSHHNLDFRRVPEFFKLFYSFDIEHKVEREWILTVLEEGLTDRYCYELCDQQGIFQTLLAFSSSPLCNEYTQTHIIRVLRQASRVTRAAYNLTKVSGLLTWMLQVVERRNLDLNLLSAIIDLLHVLWFTNLGQKENQVDGTTTCLSAGESPKSAKRCLPLPLINEFLCVAFSVIRHLRMGVKAAHLSLFLQTLRSVLKHCRTALSMSKQANWLTLIPQPLSCAEALTLLQFWASLSHSATILAQLHSVAEKHRVKDLLGTGKDKARGKGSFTLTGDLGDDTEAEKREQALLSECKPYLSSIFVHWEPVCTPTVPQSSQLSQPSDKQDARLLVNDTAHLLTKWSLRALVEGPFDESRTVDFLQWFHNVVIPHKDVVEVVVGDPGIRVDFLALYHQAFESPCQSHSSSRVETRHLFTTIMINLLESQGHTSDDLHQTALSACLLDATQEQSKREAGLVLLSLYIHELWSGAQTAQLFLFHAKLVTGAKFKGRKSSRRSLTETAIGTICNDIVSTMKST